MWRDGCLAAGFGRWRTTDATALHTPSPIDNVVSECRDGTCIMMMKSRSACAIHHNTLITVSRCNAPGSVRVICQHDTISTRRSREVRPRTEVLYLSTDPKSPSERSRYQVRKVTHIMFMLSADYWLRTLPLSIAWLFLQKNLFKL